MEGKSQTVLIILIAVVIGVAVVASFGLNTFTSQYNTIPVPTLSAESTEGNAVDGQENSTLVRVEVTPQTVQSVISTMTRPESYYRQVITQDLWGESGQGVTVAQVWVDYGWTYTVTANSNGVERSSIVGDETVWWWYEGDRTAMEASADYWSADVEGQRIPTYEELLDLDKSTIIDAGYEERGGLYCIYVVAEVPTLDWERHYWISEESGLLVATETWDGDTLISTMFSYDVERPVPDNTVFALPNGKTLHRVSANG